MSENEKKELETKKEASKKPAKADAPKKTKPVEKKKKGNLSRYLREMKSELKKVTWPDRKDTTSKTGTVLLCVAIVGVFVWIFDGISGQLISALLNLFGH